ncbi:putative peptidoglycan binding domain protein [Lysobacter antibioticus]|uniref:Putative peptidoglycan binding domain protein n=1 Tax=Lysobacter antibioticus TaxID=84531 RepID=A0A0S2F6L9_LYSAN|nr:putative peptidoglycan binding domain protein [Lysobacter antibioticus]
MIPEANLEGLTSHERPKAIILAGQPGAGKGGLKTAVELELSGDVAAIDPDELRDYHPEARNWRKSSPYGWSQQTNADAGQWSRELREAAIEGRKNLIVDTTLGNAKPATQMIRELQAAGYEVEVRAMATHRLESEHGVDERFTKNIDKFGVGRDVPLSFHDDVYRDLPDNLDKVRDATDVPVRIFDRSGAELYDSRRDSTLPSAALREARDARLQDPEVTQQLRERWQKQAEWHRDLPNTIAQNDKVPASTAEALLREQADRGKVAHSAQRAEAAATLDELVRPGAPLAHAPQVDAPGPGIRKATVIAGASALGVAASVYDAKQTGDRIGTLLAQDNPLAAQSQFAHYAARGTGGWLGGAAAGLAVGWETGPGAIAFVAVGAIAGSEAGERVAKWWDERQVYNQTDRNGVDWEYNGKQWLRQEPGDLRDDGVTIAEKQSFAALPDKARELTYLASNSSSALAMGKLEPPRDPYVLPANETDKHSFAQADWQRNGETGDWVRQVVIARTDRGHPLVNPEKASPERAAELDRMSEQVVRDNIASGPAPIAARYEQAYRRNGWDAFGPMPQPVLAALAEPNSLQASDGHQYRRDDEGQWQRQDGLTAGRPASGNLQRELDSTRAELQTQLVQHDRHLLTIPQWQAPSLDEQDRANVMSTYAALGIKPNPERLDAVMDALQRTREAHGIDPHASSLHVERSPNGGYDIDSPLAHLRRDNGVVQIVAVTSTAEIQQALADRRERAAPIPDTPELRVAALSPQQREAHQQAEREANRQGLSRDEVQHAAQQAAVATASPDATPSVPTPADAQPARGVAASAPTSDPRREAEPAASPALTVATPAPIAETAPEPERPQSEAATQPKAVPAELSEPEAPTRTPEPTVQSTASMPAAPIQSESVQPDSVQPAPVEPALVQPAPIQLDSAQSAAVAPAVAISSAANKQDDVLRPGDRGQEVELMQYRLNRVGYRDPEGQALAQNGHYDAATEQAVRRFQRDQGLADTGMADPATQQAMSAAQHARIESGKTAGQNPQQTQARAPSDTAQERPATVAQRDDETPSQAARELGSRAPSNEPGSRTTQPAERPQPTEFIAQEERAALRPQTDEAQQSPARATAYVARDEQPQAPARSHEPAQQADAFAAAPERTASPRTTETTAIAPTRESLRESAREPAPMSSPAQPEPLFSLSRLTPNDQAMFAKIRASVPADVPDETVAKAMLEAKRNGIPDADRIDKAAVVDGKLWVAGSIPGFHAGVSVAEQAPAMQDTLRETQAFNQQRDERLAQESTQKAQDEPGRATRMQ